MADDALAFLDDEGEEIVLDRDEAAELWSFAGGLEAATVSACPGCRSRVVACVALAALLEDSAPHARTRELVELAEDAPTLHLYVEDLLTDCRHRDWHDPGHGEWAQALRDLAGELRGRH